MTRMLAAPVAALAILAAFAAPALADSNIDDVHCLIVEMDLYSSNVPALRSASALGQMYWLGKLDGRDPRLDMEKLMIAELPKMTGDVLKNEATRCGNELKARGAAETAMGQDLAKKAQVSVKPAEKKS